MGCLIPVIHWRYAIFLPLKSPVFMRVIRVPEEGVEPTRPCGHRILSPARLPVPPLRASNSK